MTFKLHKKRCGNCLWYEIDNQGGNTHTMTKCNDPEDNKVLSLETTALTHAIDAARYCDNWQSKSPCPTCGGSRVTWDESWTPKRILCPDCTKETEE